MLFPTSFLHSALNSLQNKSRFFSVLIIVSVVCFVPFLSTGQSNLQSRGIASFVMPFKTRSMLLR
jgi:hypothetical protein